MEAISQSFVEALKKALADRVSKEMTEDSCYDFEDITEIDSHPCSFAHGVTKGVLIFDDLDIVVKIPFKGVYNYSYNEETDTEESFFENFSGATIDSNWFNWDYCKREVELYEKAVAAGVGEFFLEEKKLCEVNGGYPIYVQKKADQIGDNGYHYIWEAQGEEDAIKEVLLFLEDKDTMRMSEYFIFLLAQKYTLDKVEKFFDFCKDEGISDLHSKNYGFCKENPVLIDYSGFYDTY